MTTPAKTPRPTSRKRKDAPTSAPPSIPAKRAMHTAEALAHVGDSVLDFGRRFESSTEKLVGAIKPAYDASPVRRTTAMRLAAKEEVWLTLPQQIQFSQHLETTTKADSYIMWGEKPSPQRKAYVATILGILPPLDSDDPFF
ncbi:hypothetical protein EDB83DRAFT_2230145 [Lactarius deliciosus]|nr:hypothetical protein EDB83DRAFT_2230145 [Lactarius deliciosus]